MIFVTAFERLSYGKAMITLGWQYPPQPWHQTELEISLQVVGFLGFKPPGAIIVLLRNFRTTEFALSVTIVLVKSFM